jgi:hypothetical protein
VVRTSRYNGNGSPDSQELPRQSMDDTLDVMLQMRFDTVGRSCPEFVSGDPGLHDESVEGRT